MAILYVRRSKADDGGTIDCKIDMTDSRNIG